MRKRLVELIKRSSQYMCEQDSLVECIADYLLANGVIVPPCKLGCEINGEIVHKIDYAESLSQCGIYKEAFIHTMNKEDIDSIIFCSHPIAWEDAERLLQKGENLEIYH